MQYLHTMVRVSDLQASLAFYCDALGLVETSRTESEAGRFTLIFLAAPEDLDMVKSASAPLRWRNPCHERAKWLACDCQPSR